MLWDMRKASKHNISNASKRPRKPSRKMPKSVGYGVHDAKNKLRIIDPPFLSPRRITQSRTCHLTRKSD